MKVRVLLAGVLGGIVLFNWGFVAHMVLPLGMMGMCSIPNEASVASAIRADVPEPGMYMLPGLDLSKSPSETQMKERELKVKEGPSGTLDCQSGTGRGRSHAATDQGVHDQHRLRPPRGDADRSAQDELRWPASVRDVPRLVCLDRRVCAELELVFLPGGIHSREGRRVRRWLGSRRACSGRDCQASPTSR